MTMTLCFFNVEQHLQGGQVVEPHGGPGGVPGDPPICWWLTDGYLVVNLMIRHG